jgi:hypothetical protein
MCENFRCPKSVGETAVKKAHGKPRSEALHGELSLELRLVCFLFLGTSHGHCPQLGPYINFYFVHRISLAVLQTSLTS